MSSSEALISELERSITVSDDVKTAITRESLTLQTFGMLNEDDLRELGLKMGDRKILWKWICDKNGCNSSMVFKSVTEAYAPPLMSTAAVSLSPSTSAEDLVSARPYRPETSQTQAESIEATLMKYCKPKQRVNGEQLVKKLKAAVYYTTTERIFLVKVLGRHLMKTCAIPDRPSGAEKTALAQAIVDTFPVLRDSTTANGYEAIYDAKSHTGFLECYIRNRRSRDPLITTMWKHKQRSVPFEVTISLDDERVLRERRPNSSNNAELMTLMQRTRGNRRDWIMSDKPTITEILRRFPRFQDMNCALKAEFQAVMPEDSRGVLLRVEWHRLCDRVVELGKAKSEENAFLAELLAKIQDEYAEDVLSEISFCTLVHLLPVPPQKGKKHPRLSPQAIQDMFFCNLEGDTGVQDFVTKCEAQQPMMFRCQSSLWLKVDKMCIQVTDVSCFADAVELLVASFWVFNVEYPYHLKPFYEVLECLMRMKKVPRSVVAADVLRNIRSSL